MEADTIAALCTAPGDAGIAVIRISGPEAFTVADRVARCAGVPPSARPSHTVAHARIGDRGRELDEAVLVLMRAPRSFTREDVVEVQCHGGRVTARRVLRRILEAGARPAEPGEFTRRAFLNGRIDLLQAEAVADLIGAQSERAASAALEQLEGALSARFNRVYDALLAAAGELEATLDFPEDELPEPVLPRLGAGLAAAEGEMAGLLETWDEGHLLREGATVVISGKPNAGKSSLLNALLGADRAIVSGVPGTTRDSIEEAWVLDGIPLRLVDTAGLRDSDCAIEQEGIRRTRRRLARADVQVVIVDRSEVLETADGDWIRGLDPGRTVIVLNKGDLPARVDRAVFAGFRVVETCLLRGDGVEALRRALAGLLDGGGGHGPPHPVISERHRRLLVQARAELGRAREVLGAGSEPDVVVAASLLRDALDILGAATGRVYHAELLDSIFSRFCIGK